VRLQAFEVADEEHPEEDAGRHSGWPHRLGVVGGTAFLDQRVEAVLRQKPIQCRVERMAPGDFGRSEATTKASSCRFRRRFPRAMSPPGPLSDQVEADGSGLAPTQSL